MQVKDAPFATLLMIEERMENETRRMYYVRREASTLHQNFTAVYGIATEQGFPWRP